METEKKSHGALIGSIIIIVLLIIGGIYIWQTKVKKIQEYNKQVEEQLNNLNSENIDELNNLEQDLSSLEIDLEVNNLETLE